MHIIDIQANVICVNLYRVKVSLMQLGIRRQQNFFFLLVADTDISAAVACPLLQLAKESKIILCLINIIPVLKSRMRSSDICPAGQRSSLTACISLHKAFNIYELHNRRVFVMLGFDCCVELSAAHANRCNRFRITLNGYDRRLRAKINADKPALKDICARVACVEVPSYIYLIFRFIVQRIPKLPRATVRILQLHLIVSCEIRTHSIAHEQIAS